MAGYHEGLAIEGVEALGDVAGEFEVLRLIVTYRHDGGLVEQDVGGHEDGILEDAVTDGFLRGRFDLELGHAFEPAHGRDAGEHPGEFGVGGHLRLDDDVGALGVDTSGEEERRNFKDLGAEFLRLLIDRDRVQIDDTENALVFVLNPDEIAEGSEVIADMQIAGGLDAREDTCSHEVEDLCVFNNRPGNRKISGTAATV